MIIKGEYNTFTIKTGDDTLDNESKTQLTLTYSEVAAALNTLKIVDQVLKAALKERSRQHAILLERLS